MEKSTVFYRRKIEVRDVIKFYLNYILLEISRIEGENWKVKYNKVQGREWEMGESGLEMESEENRRNKRV